MDLRDNWQVKIVEEDALLFKEGPDGSVTMRAVPRKQWEMLLTEQMVGDPRLPMADAHRPVGKLRAGAGPASAGTTKYFEAARSDRM